MLLLYLKPCPHYKAVSMRIGTPVRTRLNSTMMLIRKFFPFISLLILAQLSTNITYNKTADGPTIDTVAIIVVPIVVHVLLLTVILVQCVLIITIDGLPDNSLP